MTRKRQPLSSLRPDRVYVAPSILAADFARLGAEIRAVEEAGADLIHVDVMDGHFVPNLTVGPTVVAAVRPGSRLPFDVHLMLSNPEKYIESFAAVGADGITIHVEIEANVADTLCRIRALGCSAGLSLRPGTAVAALGPHLESVDLILVMSVEPGFGGQSFQTQALDRIRGIRTMLRDVPHPVHVEVDGGIGRDTAPQVTAAGANIIVAGTSVFRDPDGVPAAIAALRGSS